MKISSFSHSTFSISAALALLAGCGGSQPPIGAPGAIPQSRAIVTHAARGTSWMAPDAVTQDLLYVSNCCWVSVYSYPNGKLEGRLKGFSIAGGECVDNKGDVYITDVGQGRVYEYGHGKSKRDRNIFSPVGAEGCAIDLATGNLAVSGGNASGGNAGVAIFKAAHGNPTVYTDPAFWEYYFCGYDRNGDLFVDGLSSPGTGHFVFAELPKGGSKLNTVTLNQYIGWPGGVQWVGKYLAVGDQVTPAIYQFTINGSQGTKVGTTRLGSGEGDAAQFFIQGSTVVAPDQCAQCQHTNVQFFRYPSGGKATKRITKGTRGPDGAAVSLAPH
jgi:hypothetical protein